MKKILLGLAVLWLASSTQAHAQTQPNNLMAAGLYCLNVAGTAWIPQGGAAGACIGASTSGSVASIGSQYPTAAVPITSSPANGTTGAIVATLTPVTGHTAYICGFAARANATGAVNVNLVVSGTISGSMNFLQWIAPVASGIGLTEERFNPCVPASAVTTNIVVTTGAPGSGGAGSLSAWGYSL